MQNRELVRSVHRTPIIPQGFADERALIDSLAHGCRDQKVLMVTGNYTVKPAVGMKPDDPRLLGPDMLLTVELCARVSWRCTELGIEPPSIMLLPNDIAPGSFSTPRESQRFKAEYSIPDSITSILAGGGIISDPVFFFNRWFDRPGKEVESRMLALAWHLSQGYEKLIVVFEGYAQNLAAKMLSRGDLFKPGDLKKDDILPQCRSIEVPMTIKNSFFDSTVDYTEEVTVTNPNGAPKCSFLAATLYMFFENLGYTSVVGTWVDYEYPCVDYAAALYKHVYEGKMPVRNIFMSGNAIQLDHILMMDQTI